ncbi:TrbC/VirB2 family protein [Acinetobacter pollinis]|uniref:TrbC/VirB2 family protein n=1 Tax=Acinetobacter pollinis TaxID=2605270 RepID=UPI0018A29D69|nr:TrbC/VirB2 family protein [Acinetobacter pollinis]MBF7691184.1 TrbC/VirB2 family protein [Acinetobacter pollinis]MBF7698876.1 TrbC/VirB2 family protein [Acinetobacter pollinis]
MKTFNKFALVALSFLYMPFAYAGVGQKIAHKFTQYNDELTVAAVAIFVFGLILCGISMAGGGSQTAKNWGKGLLIGGLLVFFAPDLADLIAH